MTSRRWAAQALGCALSFSACSLSLDVPEGAEVSCVTTADCPEGFVCSSGLSRCIVSDGEDVPPAITGTPLVEPAAVRPGGRFTVTFTVSELLAVAPVVRLGDTVLSNVASAPPSFSFTGEVAADANDGAFTLFAELVDIAGNTTPPLAVGTVMIDGTAARLIVGEVSPTLAGPNQLVAIELTANEPILPPTAEILWFDGTRAPVVAESSGDPASYAFSYIATALDASGPVRVLVRMVDVAGNTSEDVIEGLILDSTPPAVESAELSLVPPAGIVLPTASRATTGTTVRVAFVLDEAVVDDPVLSSDVDIDLARISADGALTRIYEGVIQSAAAAGPHAIQALVRDLVGNVATLEVATVVVDNVAPTAVDVDTGDLVVYERHPWGTIADGPARLAVRVAAAAYAVDALDNDEAPFSAHGHLLLCSAAAGCGDAATLARAALGPSAVNVELTIDHEETSLWVALLDRAGNVSQPRAVRDVIYTMVSKTDPLHAHRGGSTSDLGPTIFEQHLVDDVGDLLATGDARTLDARADARWTELAGGTPGALYGASLVYDSGADALVLFGGKNDGSTCLGAANGGNCGNTFRLNLATPSTWSMVANTGPGPRMGAAAIYVPTTGTILLHGGRGAGSLSDTWEWNGSAWTQRTTVGPASVHHSLVFDRKRQRVLMVGCTTTVLRAWNDGTSAWDPVATTGGSLPCFAPDFPVYGAAYDEDADQVIAFGNGTEYVIDLTTGVMTSALMPQIAARYQPRMLWDPLRRGVLLHGGVLIAGTGSCEGSGSAHCQNVWLRKGGVWSVLDAELDVPDAPHASRQLGAMAYDDLRYRVYMFGGLIDTQPAFTNVMTEDSTWMLGASTHPAVSATHIMSAAGGGTRAPLGWFINMQPPLEQTPAGYWVDNGDAYGARVAGSTYGWVNTSGVAFDATSRVDLLPGVETPDLRYRTMVRMVATGFPTIGWRIALPDDDYRIAVGVGEGLVNLAIPQCLNLNGAPFIASPLSPAQPNLTAETSVTVSGAPLALSDCTPPASIGTTLNFVHVYPATSIVRRIRVAAQAAGRGYAVDSRRAIVIDALGGAAVPFTPGSYSVGMAGETPNRRFKLLVRNTSTTDAATVNSLCITVNSGTPVCKTPAAQVAVSRRWSQVIDLHDAALPEITGLDVSVDITHPNASLLEVTLVADRASHDVIDGSELQILGPFTWETLASNDAAVGSLAPITWDSDVSNGPFPLTRRFQGTDNRLELVVVPRGVSGDDRDVASVEVDRLRSEVTYRLPP